MNCIVVDDSKVARVVIAQLIAQVDFLELRQECASPVEAFNFLKKEDVDLIFLDVEMPGMTGIELIKKLEKRPIIILITAKKDYAIEAFELNIADYIVKPVSLSRFMLAVDRAKELYNKKNQKPEIGEKENGSIFVRSNSILTKIKIKDIIYIQALGDYVNIFTADKHFPVHITLKGMEEKLKDFKFFRLHRSYLVGIEHIDKIEENVVHAGKHRIPISELFKKDLIKKLNLI